MDSFVEICTYVLAAVFGLCFGSFSNVLIYRLPRGMNIAKPPSHCTTCDYQLKWYDNIPVLSYIFLGGKCRKCRQRISPRYTIVELFVCLAWLACAVWFYDFGLVMIIASCFAMLALTVAFFTDIEQYMVPDSMIIIIALSALAVLISGLCGQPTPVTWYEQLIGLAVGFGFFALFYFGFLLIRKYEGLGFGDVKLMGAAGFLLGWKCVILCIIISCILAIVAIPFVMIFKRSKDMPETTEVTPDNGDAITPVDIIKEKTQTSAEAQETDTITAQAQGEEINNSESSTAAQTVEGQTENATEYGEENLPGEVKGSAIPFAPFIAIATVVCLFFGNIIVDWYMGLFM